MRARLRDLVDIFPPVFAVGEAIQRFLSFEYEDSRRRSGGTTSPRTHLPTWMPGRGWMRMRMTTAMIRMARTIAIGLNTTSLV